jgi:cytochrome c-type biogenesis protein CcmH/NrfG
LNVSVYPNAFNTYDSLGEAYLANNERELAITNYKKSLELNPRNANATDVLKRIEAQ